MDDQEAATTLRRYLEADPQNAAGLLGEPDRTRNLLHDVAAGDPPLRNALIALVALGPTPAVAKQRPDLAALAPLVDRLVVEQGISPQAASRAVAVVGSARTGKPVAELRDDLERDAGDARNPANTPPETGPDAADDGTAPVLTQSYYLFVVLGPLAGLVAAGTLLGLVVTNAVAGVTILIALSLAAYFVPIALAHGPAPDDLRSRVDIVTALATLTSVTISAVLGIVVARALDYTEQPRTFAAVLATFAAVTTTVFVVAYRLWLADPLRNHVPSPRDPSF